MNINHISVSRKSVWNECKQLYKYKYHLELPTPDIEEPFYFIYGKIVHKIAEQFVGGKGAQTLNEIASDVLSGKIPIEKDKEGNDVLAPPLPKEYKAKLPAHLRSIDRLTQEIGVEGIVEFEFLYDLDPPHKRYVKGFIDRIIQKGDNIFIFDYKTSKKNHFRKNFGNISDDLQLRTYARVAQKHYNVPAKNIRAALYYLEGGNLIGSQFSEASLVRAEQELLEAYKQIQEMPEDKAWGNVGDWCRRCPYRKICPFYRLT